MILVREVRADEAKTINDVVMIHLDTFEGFFLSFMGRGFLKQMYRSYCEYTESTLLVAEDNGVIIGFLSYSENFSGLYKYMIKAHFLSFAWYSFGAFLRRPSAFMHIISAFAKPNEVKREVKYVELSSIGVAPQSKSMGVGTSLIEALKMRVNFDKFDYITLETDADNNDSVLHFYERNGFVKNRMFITKEGRSMYEYRYIGE